MPNVDPELIDSLEDRLGKPLEDASENEIIIALDELSQDMDVKGARDLKDLV